MSSPVARPVKTAEFVLECRILGGYGQWGNWFRVWNTEDGADCAAYLKASVEQDTAQHSQVRQFRMLYVV